VFEFYNGSSQAAAKQLSEDEISDWKKAFDKSESALNEIDFVITRCKNCTSTKFDSQTLDESMQ